MPISGLSDIRISPLSGCCGHTGSKSTGENCVFEPKEPLHWRSVITTAVNHFIAMISVLPECPANQIFLSLLNTLGGMDFYSQLPGEPTRTEGRDTWGIQEVGHAGQLWALGGLSNPGCDLAPALPTG